MNRFTEMDKFLKSWTGFSRQMIEIHRFRKKKLIIKFEWLREPVHSATEVLMIMYQKS